MLTTVATCNLAQWALDFSGNLARIAESLSQAKQKKARYRIGPELEVCGYSCEDHFLEMDTFFHCWQSMAWLLAPEQAHLTSDLLCDIGMPVLHHGVRYNCRVFVLDGKILLIRPKRFLANDGNYRELRWFQAWYVRASDLFLPRHFSHFLLSQGMPLGLLRPIDSLTASLEPLAKGRFRSETRFWRRTTRRWEPSRARSYSRPTAPTSRWAWRAWRRSATGLA